MKIGIITLTGYNYGNNLQNLAVIKIIEKLGFEAETLKTEYEYTFLKLNKHNFKILVKMLFGKKDYLQLIRNIRFKNFSDLYLKKSKRVYNEIVPLEVNDYDYLLFGSDQIWNFTYDRSINGFDYYMGNFYSSCPKITYSASIGVDYIPSKFEKSFVNSIESNFSSISVREYGAKELIESITNRKDIKVTIDPTLMLNKYDWQEIEKKPSKFPYNKYILTYFLGDVDQERLSFINECSEQFGLKVINLSSGFNIIDKINKDYYTVRPDEFIWLINHSTLLFTDSFHGSVFSILFEKPFRCFSRKDTDESMSSRMDTLFEMFGIREWCIGDVNEDIDHVLYKNYDGADKVLEEQREYAFNYLKNALNI